MFVSNRIVAKHLVNVLGDVIFVAVCSSPEDGDYGHHDEKKVGDPSQTERVRVVRCVYELRGLNLRFNI